MTYQCIETELVDSILIVRQNRPTKANARNQQMYAELRAALQTAQDDDEISTVLLTATGKFFCAGMDFNDSPRNAYEILPTDSALVRQLKSDLPTRVEDDVSTLPAVKFIESFINFDKLLVGAVNGPAIGEGFSSLLHCDLVYAVESAYFWAPFARAGVAPEFCSTVLMPRRLGNSLANAAIYLGKRISASEAHAAGFVNEVFKAEDFEAQVIEALRTGLALTGPPELRAQTLKAYKQLVYDDSERARLTEQCHREFNLVRQRGSNGETRTVQEYYAAQLPS